MKVKLTLLLLSVFVLISGCEKEIIKPKLPVLGKAPDFTMQTIGNNRQAFYGVKRKVRLVEFFYANCPDICPVTTANLVKIQNKLKQEVYLFGMPVEFISITFDPHHDTPALLKQYARKLGVDRANWMFMRGTDQETKNAAKGFHVFYELNKDGSVNHTINSLFLVDSSNNIRGVYKEGNKMPVEQITKDIETLVKS